MEIIILWLFFSAIVGAIAGAKGRSGAGWFFMSLIFPFLFLIIILLMPSIKPTAIQAGGEVATPETHVRCPECRELVRMDARKCKHCGCSLIPQLPQGQ